MSIQEWISLGVGVVGFLAALLSRWGRLPANVRKWLKAVGEGRVFSLIEIAAADLSSKKTDAEKRAWVAGEIKKIAYEKEGLRIPDSVANLIVEQVYQRYKQLTTGGGKK